MHCLFAICGGKDCSQIRMSVRVIRTDAQSFSKLSDCSLFVIMLRQDEPHVVVGFCIIWPQTHSLTKLRQYLLAVGPATPK